jgi:hypothetical protein
MKDHRIVGVHITDRASHAGEVQNILSKYGKNIRTRLGLHEISEDSASPNGLIVIEVVGSNQEIDALSDELRRLKGVQVQSMFFSHPE